MIYVFEITVKRGVSPEDYMEAWQRGSEVIQRSAGAKGIRLFQKIGEQNKLLNIASWDSKISRDMAMEALKHADGITRGMLHKHEDFGTVQIIGAYDEISKVDAQIEPKFGK